MKKNILILISIFFLLSWLAAQEEPGISIEKKLKELRENVVKLKQQNQVEPSKEIELEIERIKKEMHELEKALQQQKFAENDERKFKRTPRFDDESEMPEAPIRDFLQEMQQNSPQDYKRLIELRRKNPQEFKKVIKRIFHERKNKEFEKIKKHDPELATLIEKEMKLSRQLEELLQKMEKLNYEQRAAQSEEIRKLLTEIFDIRVAKHEYEISKVQKHLEEMKQTLERRLTNKQSIIDKKAKDIIGEQDEWDW